MSDTAHELLVRNRGYLARIQLAFALFDFLIGDICSRRRQRVEEFGGQRRAFTLGQSHSLQFDFCKCHRANIQTRVAACNRDEGNQFGCGLIPLVAAEAEELLRAGEGLV